MLYTCKCALLFARTMIFHGRRILTHTRETHLSLALLVIFGKNTHKLLYVWDGYRAKLVFGRMIAVRRCLVRRFNCARWVTASTTQTIISSGVCFHGMNTGMACRAKCETQAPHSDASGVRNKTRR